METCGDKVVPGKTNGVIDMEKLILECDTMDGYFLEVDPLVLPYTSLFMRMETAAGGEVWVMLGKTKVIALRDKLNEYLEHTQETDIPSQAGNTTGILVAPEKK